MPLDFNGGGHVNAKANDALFVLDSLDFEMENLPGGEARHRSARSDLLPLFPLRKSADHVRATSQTLAKTNGPGQYRSNGPISLVPTGLLRIFRSHTESPMCRMQYVVRDCVLCPHRGS